MATDVKATPMFIGGKEVAGASGKTVDVYNPRPRTDRARPGGQPGGDRRRCAPRRRPS
jgi:hypothetical protein